MHPDLGLTADQGKGAGRQCHCGENGSAVDLLKILSLDHVSEGMSDGYGHIVAF